MIAVATRSAVRQADARLEAIVVPSRVCNTTWDLDTDVARRASEYTSGRANHQGGQMSLSRICDPLGGYTVTDDPAPSKADLADGTQQCMRLLVRSSLYSADCRAAGTGPVRPVRHHTPTTCILRS